MLTVNQLDNGVVPRREVLFDLAALAVEIVDDADFEARGRGCAVRILQTAPCPVSDVRDHIRSAMENTVRNGLVYTPRSTEIHVTVRREQAAWVPCAVVVVRDHGPGVPEDSPRENFWPFYRAAEARERGTGGTGLVLTIAERAIRMHGGSVRASNASGGGLEVQLILPLAPPVTPAPGPSTGMKKRRRANPGSDLKVVEDSPHWIDHTKGRPLLIPPEPYPGAWTWISRRLWVFLNIEEKKPIGFGWQTSIVSLANNFYPQLSWPWADIA